MIKKLFVMLGALFALSSIAFADLGDTMQSSQAKYGNPTLSGNPHQLIYYHNECGICHTYNDNGICVVVEFYRLDGKKFSNTVRTHLDATNLSPMALNSQGNGWLYENWKNNSYVRNATSWTWDNGNIQYQVVDGQMRFGNDAKWYWVREYITPEGVQIMRADNAANAAKAANATNNPSPNQTEANPKVAL